MRHYNYFQPLVLGFFSKTLYKDVGQNWEGWGVLYVFFLAAILCLPLTLHLGLGIAQTTKYLEPFIQQFPVITLKNGQASLEGQPAPYFIKDPKTNEVVAIFDPTGKITSLENSHARILLTKDKLWVKEGEGTLKFYNLSMIRDGKYDQQIITQLVHFIGYFALVLSYFVALFLSLVEALVAMLLFATLVKFLTHTKLPFKTLCRLAAIAITPAVILAVLLSLFRIHIPYVWILYILITLFYLFYALEANKETDIST